MCKKATRILLVFSKSSKALLIKYESVGEILAPRLSRAMSEMARWQEQESESEVKFQHNNTSSKNGELGVRRGIYLYLERQTYLSWINAKCPPPSIRVDLKARAHHLGFES
jgi:hypothetical protein